MKRPLLLPALVAAALTVAFSLHAAALSDTPDGWRGVAARDEIKPAFSFNSRGGPAHTGSLVIRTEDRKSVV
jgi:hypothetical protein